MSWLRLPQKAKACKVCWLFNINEGLVLLKLAGIVLSLINPSPSYVKFFKPEHFKPLNATLLF